MTIYYTDESVTLHLGDALEVAQTLPDGGVDCIVTSPPYFGLRDYGTEGQYGLEDSPAEYVETMRTLFAELRRVLADDGTFWLNIGDSYSAGGQGGNRGGRLDGGDHLDMVPKPTRVPGFAPKNLLGMPWRVAFALQDDGWILRNAIIWHKPNAMPESVTDRLSGRYEHVFLFSKSKRYWFDLDPIREPCTTQHEAALNWARNTKESDVPGQGYRQHRLDRTPYAPGMNPQNIKTATGKQHKLPETHPGTRNPGDVWSMPTQPFSAAHFAVYPVALPQRCILAGCAPARCIECGFVPDGDTHCGHNRYRVGTVLDPFSGSGTTGLAAQRTGRKYVGIDLNRDYLDLSLRTRLGQSALDFQEGA